MTDERYQQALDFAAKMHKGQLRRGGDEYITHPVAVAEILKSKGYDGDYLITALFHDLLEDTSATEEEIFAIGGERVLTAVKLLTKKKGCDMGEYLGKIRTDEIAFAVKAADRLHNLRSAMVAGDKFKIKYIIESLQWFLDFDEEILPAIKALMQTVGE